MKNIIFFFFFCFSFFIKAQDATYLKEYENTLGYEAVKFLSKNVNNEVYIFSTAETPNNIEWDWTWTGRKINLVDGTVLHKFQYNFLNNHSIDPNGGVINGSNFIVTGSTRSNTSPTNDEGNVFIGEVTNEGEVLWATKIGNPAIREWGVQLRQLSNSDLIISGWKYRDEDSVVTEGILLKTTATGDSLWRRIIRGNVYKVKGVGVEVDEDDNIYFLGNESVRASISKYTSTGDSLWSKSYPMNGTSFPVDMKRNQTGNFIIAGYAGFGDENYRAPFFMAIDTTGEVVWVEDYVDEVIGAFAEKFTLTNTGGYAMCVGRGNGKISLLETDIKGKVLQVKDYDFSLKNPKDIIQLQDGSFMMVGNISHPFGSEETTTVWLLKTDPKGNVLLSTGTTFQQVPIKVYPNPSSNYITIDFPNLQNSNYTLKIISNTGTILKTYEGLIPNQKIDINKLTNGIYYINLFEKDRLIAVEKLVKQ